MPAVSTNAREIFLSALDQLAPRERAAFVALACEGNIVLQRHVEALLRAHEGSDSLLDQPRINLQVSDKNGDNAPATIDHPSKQVGTSIGPYKLLEQIGEGGMGLVYMAEQQRPVRRLVALKIIKPGMDCKQVIARFEAERQALAMMDHSNIARVLDVGTTEAGLPFFVMELVRGIPINTFCDQKRLTVRERLELMVQVCQAVQHAHQKGIIHRDLKPTNVLVTQNDTLAVPKVIDFGIAKALGQQLTEHTLHTGFAQLVGTPLYMSPEQAEMNQLGVDTRSDVYSLGVLLYELLTGTTPFDKERLKSVGFDEMRRIIREEEPETVSTRLARTKSSRQTPSAVPPTDGTRSVPATYNELDWIVARSLEKDRSRRYESASALAADIHRYVTGDLVQACPPSVRYRFGKYARKNRAILTTAAIVALALLLGTAISAWQAVRATNAEGLARAAAESERLARQAESKQRQFARHAVDDMYTQVAEKWLAEQGSLTEVQRQFLEKALRFYQEFSRDVSDDRRIRFESLRALERVGVIQQNLGEHDSAESSFKRLISEASELIKGHPNRSELRIALVTARTNLSKLYRSLGRVQEGNGQAELANKELQHVPTTTLNEIADRSWMGATLNDLIGELTEAGLVSQAEAAVQLCLDTWQSLEAQEPDSWDYRLGLATAYRRQGQQRMWWGGRNKEAEVALREAEKRLVQLMQEQPGNKTCRTARSGSLQLLGVICAWEKRFSEAVEFTRLAVSIQETLVIDFPDDRRVQTALVNLQGNHATNLCNDDRIVNHTEIKELGRRRFSGAERLVDRYPDVVQNWCQYVTAVHGAADGANEESLRYFDRVVQRLSKYSLPQESNAENNALIDAISIFFAYRATLLTELGDHRRAAECLAAIPSKYHSFRPDFPKAKDPAQLGARYKLQKEIESYNHQIFCLRVPSVLFLECARLAEQDEVLSDAERAQYVSDYLSRAHAFQAEVDRAIETWVRHFLTSDIPQITAITRVNGHLEFASKEIDDVKVRTGVCEYPTMVRCCCETERFVCQVLVREALQRYPQDSQIHWAVAYLTAGPTEMRDAKLALEVARKSVETRPDDGLARQHLGWALFRSDEWSACLETLLQLKKKPDSYNRAIIAMALWHLGRKDEAAGRLDANYDRELKAYIQRCEDRSKKGTYTLPTPDMVQRLDQEARELLGELLEKSGAQAAKRQSTDQTSKSEK